jgi:glycosyltransferase involved in cell wall biosynthesis
MKIPKVSVGLPVYNAENYLRLALGSLLQQDYTDFELIISDNASTDATEAICREYAAKDGRIRYYRNEKNIGACGNFNRVFELSRGEFFKWACHDDVHSPAFLKRCMEAMEKASATVALVTPKTEMIDEAGNILNQSDECLDARQARPHQRLRHVLQNLTWARAQFGLIRASVLKRTRLIQPYYASDNVLLAEIALLGEMWELPETLFQRRHHPGVSTVANKNWRELLNWFDPSGRGMKRLIPPVPRLALEMFQAIMRAELPWRERFLCCWVYVAVWIRRRGFGLGVKTALKRLFSRRSGKNVKTFPSGSC